MAVGVMGMSSQICMRILVKSQWFHLDLYSGFLCWRWPIAALLTHPIRYVEACFGRSGNSKERAAEPPMSPATSLL